MPIFFCSFDGFVEIGTGSDAVTATFDNVVGAAHEPEVAVFVPHSPFFSAASDQNACVHCDECNQDVTFDSYTLDNKNNKLCAWKATGYDAACYSTVGATNPEYHYAFGDNTCYDPCLNDDNHKKKHDEAADAGPQEKAGQFVVLDYDFEVYFPNRGDFYGNGALGLRNPQKPEGWGYIDYMDTTTWLKEKYVVFPFDVTYKGKTFLSGEKVMLGTYDEATYTWHDDDPVDYKYTFHCLLSNREKAAASIQFVARAKNCEYPDILENHDEDHNYTRYGDAIRAYHDSEKSYFIDVIGRAPNITGIARKNVNSAATYLEVPSNNAPMIVAPERDVPGTSERT